MNIKYTVKCQSCDHVLRGDFHTSCPNCKGLLEVLYPLDRVKIRDSDNPYERYFDLLPILDIGLLPNEKMTPLIKAKNLGHRLGLDNLYLKDETFNKTRSTKDRMANVSLPYLFESGVRHFCTSSTGNSSTAYAQAIDRFPLMKISLLTAENFVPRVNYKPNSQITHYGLRNANFVEASEYATIFSQKRNLTSEGGFFNLARREGLKTIWFEIIEQLPSKIDWYVQAVSSAMGVHGVNKAAHEALSIGMTTQTPRLLCAQQMSCSPMVKAWEEGCESIQPHHIEKNPVGIAEAILRGNPTRAYPHVRKIVKESGGEMVSVSESEIIAAQKMVLDEEGIEICFAASTAVAAIGKLAKNASELQSQTIVINLSGGIRDNQPGVHVDQWLDRVGDNEWLNT